MREEDLRALVRESIGRHLGSAADRPPDPGPLLSRSHPSHRRLSVHNGSEGDGPCLIEPAVPCTDCGYCQSYGH